jgi:peptide/nickel transport system substrate-binding protein
VVAQQLNDAGVQVKVNQIPVDTFFSGYPTAHPFFSSSWFHDFYLPNVGFTTVPGATWPETGFSNARYDALYKQAIGEVDKAKRDELCHEMQRIDYEEGGYIIPTFFPNLDAAAPNVRGLVPSKGGVPLNGFQFVDVSVN